MKSFLSFVWEIAKIVVIASLIVIPIRYFLFQPFFVRGQSMEPNFGNGDYLIIDEITYRFRSPERGEVIVFKFPQNTSQRYIKRIVGLPGETVEIKDGRVMIVIDGQKLEVLDESSYLPAYLLTAGNLTMSLGQDEYFVLGDNRSVSSDSRRWGIVPKEDIIGRVYFRAWPIPAMAKIELPAY
jgi:signal peptidase I